MSNIEKNIYFALKNKTKQELKERIQKYKQNIIWSFLFWGLYLHWLQGSNLTWFTVSAALPRVNDGDLSLGTDWAGLLVACDVSLPTVTDRAGVRVPSVAILWGTKQSIHVLKSIETSVHSYKQNSTFMAFQIKFDIFCVIFLKIMRRPSYEILLIKIVFLHAWILVHKFPCMNLMCATKMTQYGCNEKLRIKVTVFIWCHSFLYLTIQTTKHTDRHHSNTK